MNFLYPDMQQHTRIPTCIHFQFIFGLVSIKCLLSGYELFYQQLTTESFLILKHDSD